MLAFVDDTRKFNNIILKHPKIHENILDDLQTWQQMSNLIGGKLNIEKCGYYILSWCYINQGYMEMENSSHPDIAINTLDTNKTQHIKKYDINDDYKYLGITTAPNGNKLDTTNALKKCVTFANKLSHATITADEAHLGLTTRFLPKIRYQLPCYYLSQTDMENFKKYTKHHSYKN